MSSFFNRLFETVLEFQRQVQEHMLFVENLHNEIHQLNILTNTDLNVDHNREMNDHMQLQQAIQYLEIHQTIKFDNF